MKMWYIFFNDTATTEIYTLSLHGALPICGMLLMVLVGGVLLLPGWLPALDQPDPPGQVVVTPPQPTATPDVPPTPLPKIGRAHVCTPVTPIPRMPTSA